MSVTLTGSKTRVVDEVQSRLDKFVECTKVYDTAKKALDELSAKNVELANKPAHEDRYQVLLSEYEKAAESLKTAAEGIEKKTDQDHIHKYFRLRFLDWRRQYYNRYSYIDRQYQEYLEAVHDEAIKIIKTDYETPITQAQTESKSRKTEALVLIEASQIDQTFPICRDKLIKENPNEYLRQAVLYQNKLLENKDEPAVLAFGIAWIKTLPKEATWQQVENMSFLVIEAAQKNKNVDLAEYRSAFEQWSKEHPLTDGSKPVDPTPEQAMTPGGRRTYVLGLLYLNNQKLDLSFKAFQIYRRCGALYPEQPVWKIQQALYHIFRREWVEAERVLGDLPEDDASLRKIRTNLTLARRERVCHAVLDLGPMVICRLLPSSYKETVIFDAANTSLQLVSYGPLRGRLIPFLSRNPADPIPFELPRITLAMMVGDLVDFACRNIPYLSNFQKVENFASNSLRMANAGWAFYSGPRSFPSVLNLGMNLGSLAISSVQSYDAWQEVRRPATLQAFLSTLQLTMADAGAVITVASYSDLAPLAVFRSLQVVGQSSAALFTAQTLSESSEDSQESSRDKWIVTAVAIGAFAAYRIYSDYPCLWAVSVMREADFYSSKGEYDQVTRVLTESEDCYFVSRARPAVRNYVAYLNRLKDYPNLLQDPAKYEEFLIDLDLALISLKESSYYRGIRATVLLKKMEAAIGQHDPIRLNEVIKEGPPGKIVVLGFQFLLNNSYYLALKDPAAACSFLQKMGPEFPSRFHPTKDTLVELYKTEAKSLQEWPQLSVNTGQQNPPSEEQIDRWKNAFPKLQGFLSKNVGETGVYQELQYYKVLSAFAQNNVENTEAFFKKSDPQLHQRFTRDLVQCTKQLLEKGKHPEAIALLKRVQFESFEDNELMQNYGQFLSLLYSAPKEGLLFEQMEVLDRCIAGLDLKYEVHQKLRHFFSFHRIVLSINAEKYPDAQSFLAQENADSKVPAEIATLLFNRIWVSLNTKSEKEALLDLNCIIGNLGSWQHCELFSAFRAYHSCDPSFEVKLVCVEPLIAHLESIERLPGLVSYFQAQRDLMQLDVWLIQDKFVEVKTLLSVSKSKEHYPKLCYRLFEYLVYRGEQLRRDDRPLKEAKKTVTDMNGFFDLPNSDMIQFYITFLDHLDNIEGKKDIKALKEASQYLKMFFGRLKSIKWSVPVLLREAITKILLDTSVLAQQVGQWRTALEALESINEDGLPVEHLDEKIRDLKELLNISSEEK